MDSIVHQFIEKIDQIFDHPLPDGVEQAAKTKLFDAVVCAIGGYMTKPASAARGVSVPAMHGKGARLWGSLSYTSAEDAAFANGVAVRYLDWNDAFRALDGTHPSDNIAALVAAAEMANASGVNLLTAIVASYEIQVLLAESVPFNDLGWDQPTAGVVAAAGAIAKLLGGTRDMVANAISIAITSNMSTYQTRRGEISQWKACAGPMGGRQGLLSARLAVEGLSGPDSPFEGVQGVWEKLGQPFELPQHTQGSDWVWGIDKAKIKRWPVRDSCQLPIQAALELRNRLNGSKPESLEITTYKSCYEGAAADQELWRPQSRETADHSLPFSVTVALLDGDVTPATFARKRYLDEDVCRLLSRTTVKVDDSFSPKGAGTRIVEIAATTASGDQIVVRDSKEPIPVEQLRKDEATLVLDKFSAVSGELLTDADRQDIAKVMWNVDHLKSARPIVDLLGF